MLNNEDGWRWMMQVNSRWRWGRKCLWISLPNFLPRFCFCFDCEVPLEALFSSNCFVWCLLFGACWFWPMDPAGFEELREGGDLKVLLWWFLEGHLKIEDGLRASEVDIRWRLKDDEDRRMMKIEEWTILLKMQKGEIFIVFFGFQISYKCEWNPTEIQSKFSC